MALLLLLLLLLLILLLLLLLLLIPPLYMCPQLRGHPAHGKGAVCTVRSLFLLLSMRTQSFFPKRPSCLR